jgi:alkylation response protein AidB-like acyl-CoA dehydrogenase
VAGQDRALAPSVTRRGVTLYHVTPHHVTLHHVTFRHVTNHQTGGNPMQEMIERGLSDEQRMIRNTIRSFVDREVTPFIRKNWEKEWDMKPENRPSRELLEAAHRIGVRTLGIPEEFGGTPVDPKMEVQTFAMVAEEIARGDCGLADKLVQIWKISKLLANIAPRHLQEKWFPRIAEDSSFLLAHCLTEPRGASDRWLPYDVPEAMMHTRAVKKGDKWVINGRKQFITNGYDAKLYVVYATTTPGAGITRGTSSFLVPRDTPGLVVQRCNETLGGRYMNNGEIVFEDCAVPQDHCLAQDVAMTRAGIYFRPGKIIVAAKNLGVGMAAFENTAEYVQNYVQGGRILIKHQAVAVRLADMATKLNAVRALLNEAIRAVDAGAHDAEVLCNQAKMFASTEIFQVTQHAVELHGGNGIMLDFGIEKYLRDASLFLHRDATVDISRFKIVKSMFPRTAGIYAGPES